MSIFERFLAAFDEPETPPVIQANVRMISGCEDKQTSADVSDVNSFCLPDPAGRAGGACTSALLRVLYADSQRPDIDLSFTETLQAARTILEGRGYSQIPQLSSSSPVNVSSTFDLVPDDCEEVGNKKAVLIGINYVGHDPGELSGCHNDVLNIKEYIMDVHGFPEENIVILMDDGEHDPPTRENIIENYRKLAAEAEAGDCIFCHYSGHGGFLPDDENEEADGYDETLVPVDYMTEGQIRDDDLFDILVKPMPAGVTLTCLMDCCHSGTILDLPFKFKADGTMEQCQVDGNFNLQKYFNKTGYAYEE